MVFSLWDQEQTSAEQVTGINLRETDHMSVLLPEKFTVIHSKWWGREKQTSWAKSSHSTYSTHIQRGPVSLLYSQFWESKERSGKYSVVSSSWIRLLVIFPQAILAEHLVALNIFMLTALCKIYFSIFSFYSWGTNTQKAVFGRLSWFQLG